MLLNLKKTFFVTSQYHTVSSVECRTESGGESEGPSNGVRMGKTGGYFVVCVCGEGSIKCCVGRVRGFIKFMYPKYTICQRFGLLTKYIFKANAYTVLFIAQQLNKLLVH